MKDRKASQPTPEENEALKLAPTRPDGRRYWTTDDETRFIRRLGTGFWSKSNACISAGRQTMLYRYREACLSRAFWGDIDKGRVMAFLDQQLMVFER